jgi:hypothetical protein
MFIIVKYNVWKKLSTLEIINHFFVYYPLKMEEG